MYVCICVHSCACLLDICSDVPRFSPWGELDFESNFRQKAMDVSKPRVLKQARVLRETEEAGGVKAVHRCDVGLISFSAHIFSTH